MSAPTIGARIAPHASIRIVACVATRSRERDRSCRLADHVGQQAEEARALDRLREFALLLGRHRGDAARHDLAALGDVALQQLARPCSRSSAHWRRRTGRSCGGGRTDGGRHRRLAVKRPWSLLLRRCGVVAIARARPRSPRSPRSPSRSPQRSPRSPKRSPRRSSRSRSRSTLRIIADGPSSSSSTRIGEVAQHVFVDALLALDLGDRRRRRIDVQQREMRLAVLVDAVGEGLHAPVFGLGDLAAQLLR